MANVGKKTAVVSAKASPRLLTRGRADGHDILKRFTPSKIKNQAISKLASDLCYVHEDEAIQDLADSLRRETGEQSVGVVDDSNRVVGIVVRDVFFTTLVRPYARDVFKNRSVKEVMTDPVTFDADTNLFSVADEITEQMKAPGISYFVLTDETGAFQGVFSTQDVLVHLSEMTQHDIALARKLQSRIVREREFVVGKSFEFTATSQTAKGVGGDFYDIRNYAEDRWAVAFCDVSGKGIAASIVTSVIWGIMSTYDFSRGLTTFVQELNDYILRTFESERFITGIFLDYNENTKELEICDMGHSHMYLFRQGRFVKIKNSQNNLPIGVAPDFLPKSDRIRPREQDVLFLLTDGMTEQENEEGSEYSIDRVSAILRESPERPVEATCDKLLKDFAAFRGNHHLNDDVTFALMRFVQQAIRL